MTQFWIGAAALCAVALSFLLWPLWRQRKETGRWSLSGLIGAALTVPIALALYMNVRTWQPEVLQKRSEDAALVAQLAARMAQQPDDVDGWRLLGRSYLMIGEYVAAQSAFAEAWQRTPVPDNELKLSLAEAQVLGDPAALGGQAGELIEQVLREEPGNPKALWYGGQRALGIGDEAQARARLMRLLQLGPPEEIAQILRAQLTQLPVDSAGDASATASVASAPGSEGPLIRMNVRLGEDVSTENLGPQAALFIFASDPNGGPPIAVVRQPANAVPGEFVLSDANTMLAGRSLAGFPELRLVARLSATGQPIEQSGDLYAEESYSAGEDDALELVIDKVVP